MDSHRHTREPCLHVRRSFALSRQRPVDEGVVFERTSDDFTPLKALLFLVYKVLRHGANSQVELSLLCIIGGT